MNTLISLDKVINVDEKLNDKESEFRKKLLDKIISSQELVALDDYEGEEKELLKSLVSKDVLVPEEGQIVFAYPVSKKPTNHHVKLADGREFFSMCAIDALGSTFVFGQDTEISSICPVSLISLSLIFQFIYQFNFWSYTEKIIVYSTPYGLGRFF